MEYAAYLRIVPFAAQNHAANAPALHVASRRAERKGRKVSFRIFLILAKGSGKGDGNKELKS